MRFWYSKMSLSAETAPVEVEDSMVSEDVIGEEKGKFYLTIECLIIDFNVVFGCFLDDGIQSEDNQENEVREQPKNIIRYSLSSLLSFRSSKSSQRMPVCINMDLSCMAHNKPPPKMPPASCMPKFALPNRGEESISPLSFNSNSSSSSNLSYQQQQHQKRYEGYQTSGGGRDPRDGRGNDGRGGDGRGGEGPGGDGYNSGNRYYYNKYNKNYDDINGSGSSRIIYKTTSANSNGNNNNTSNNIRILKKAYNNKYEEQQQQPVSTISNKNILGNSSQVMTAADYRNSTKQAIRNGGMSDEQKALQAEENKKKEDSEKASKDGDSNNNGEKADDKKKDLTKVSEVNANDLVMGSDVKNAEEINLDEIFKMYSMNNLLPVSLLIDSF